MVTWANWHYVDFVRNWVDHVRAANVTSFLVRLSVPQSSKRRRRSLVTAVVLLYCSLP